MAVDQSGETPLKNAIWDGHTELVRNLLNRGATPSDANLEGATPLMRASYKGHIETVNLLLDRGADSAVMDQSGKTPLTCAI